MNRRALNLTNQSRSGHPAATAGGVDLSSALPVPKSVCRFVSIRHAAPRIGRHEATLRRWIEDGAPYKPGSGGRSGRLVDPAQLEEWYAARHQLPVVQARPLKQLLDDIADVFLDALKRDSSGVGLPIHQVMDVPEHVAAGLFILLHRYFYLRMICTPPRERDLPASIHALSVFARTDARGGTVPSSIKGFTKMEADTCPQ